MASGFKKHVKTVPNYFRTKISDILTLKRPHETDTEHVARRIYHATLIQTTFEPELKLGWKESNKESWLNLILEVVRHPLAFRNQIHDLVMLYQLWTCVPLQLFGINNHEWSPLIGDWFSSAIHSDPTVFSLMYLFGIIGVVWTQLLAWRYQFRINFAELSGDNRPSSQVNQNILNMIILTQFSNQSSEPKETILFRKKMRRLLHMVSKLFAGAPVMGLLSMATAGYFMFKDYHHTWLGVAASLFWSIKEYVTGHRGLDYCLTAAILQYLTQQSAAHRFERAGHQVSQPSDDGGELMKCVQVIGRLNDQTWSKLNLSIITMMGVSLIHIIIGLIIGNPFLFARIFYAMAIPFVILAVNMGFLTSQSIIAQVWISHTWFTVNNMLIRQTIHRLLELGMPCYTDCSCLACLRPSNRPGFLWSGKPSSSPYQAIVLVFGLEVSCDWTDKINFMWAVSVILYYRPQQFNNIPYAWLKTGQHPFGTSSPSSLSIKTQRSSMNMFSPCKPFCQPGIDFKPEAY